MKHGGNTKREGKMKVRQNEKLINNTAFLPQLLSILNIAGLFEQCIFINRNGKEL